MNQQQLIEQKAEELQNAIGEYYMSKDWGPHGCNNYELHESVPFNTIEKAFKAGAEWMAGEGERQWISVKDRLPEDRQKVLAFGYWPDSEAASIIQAKYYSEDLYNRPSFVSHALTLKHVSHWMKLPEPPKPQTEQP